MIDIHLHGEYYITTDAYNYRLERRFIGKDKDGNDRESTSVEGFYSSVTNLLKGYREKEIRNSDCSTIEELLNVVKEIDRNIENVLMGI